MAAERRARAAGRAVAERAARSKRELVRPRRRARERDARPHPHGAPHTLQPVRHDEPAPLPRRRARTSTRAESPTRRARLRGKRPALQREPRRHRTGDDRVGHAALSEPPHGFVSAPDLRLPRRRHLRDVHRRDRGGRDARRARARHRRHAERPQRDTVSAYPRPRQPTTLLRHEPQSRALRKPRVPWCRHRALPRRTHGATARQGAGARHGEMVPGLWRT